LPKLVDASLNSVYRDLEVLKREGLVHNTARGRVAAVPTEAAASNDHR
jgi:Fe2+ or Zn2+ uptake regulation protein